MWDPCEIIWTGNGSSGGFGFLKICSSPHPQGLELSQCSPRSDWWQLWSDTAHLTWSLWHFGQGPLVGMGSWEEVWSGWWDLGWRSWILHSPQHSLASPHLLFLSRRGGTMKCTEIWGDLFLGSYNQKYSCFKLNLKAKFSYRSEQWIDLSSRSVLSCSLRTWGIFSMWFLKSSVA